MKKIIISLVGAFYAFILPAQVNDDFNDGDFTSGTIWTGGVTDFTVAAGKLQSSNTVTNSAFYLATPNTVAVNCQWEFWCRLQFNPSSANYVDIYLVSDNANLQATSVNGYFVRLGNTADDICLYKQTGTTSVKIIDGLDAVLNTSNNTLKIKVTRDASNLWELKRDLSGSGTNYVSEGSVIDATYTSSTHFGFSISQSTSSFFQKHFFDDVYVGPIINDVTAPALLSATVVNAYQLDLLFDEKVDITTAETFSNYAINPTIGNPSGVIRDATDFRLVHISTSGFTSGTNYTVTVNNVQDLAGNALSNGNMAFSYYVAKPYDVVINEIMPDPDPVVNLPNAEYIELKNKTHFAINLNNWYISTLSTVKKLPGLLILPDSFIVLTGTGNASLFALQGITAYDLTSFPALINGGTNLSLRDSNGVMIHTINYTDTWYNDANKANGGWSLEQVDPANSCGGQTNWQASVNSNGGTPGKRNSVLASNPDNTSPQLERISVINADSILLIFSEALDSVSLLNPATYMFDQGLTQPLYIGPLANDFRKVKLKLSSTLQVGLAYHCTVGNQVFDCAGNTISANNTLPFALPEAAAANDIVINEVLFSPKSGGYDFLELYNRSHKTIDLKNVRIGSMDTVSGTLTSTKPITAEGYLLFPGNYVVLTENSASVKQQYMTPNPHGFLDVADLPAMNVDDDVVTISDATGLVIDNLIYTDKMHFPLLADHKGVSLERIDFNRTTHDKTNWNSAAQNVGFATPAYRNSQYMMADGGSGVNISNELFSPDNDGYQDVLDITYDFDEPGKSANIFIYDSKGRQVRHLVKNEQLSQAGTISWNGINDNNEKAPIGMYVVYCEVFNTKGKVNSYKLSCVLAGKL